MQVLYNNTWGWVCADQWDKNDADVACRMTNFLGSSSFIDKGKNKETAHSVWLNNMQCKGNEDSLFSCVHDGLGFHFCEEKAGAICRPRGKNISSKRVRLKFDSIM